MSDPGITIHIPCKQQAANSPTAAGTQVVAWGIAEVAVAIMAASLPILRALVKRHSEIPMGYDSQNPAGITGPGMHLSSLPTAKMDIRSMPGHRHGRLLTKTERWLDDNDSINSQGAVYPTYFTPLSF